MKKLFLIFTLLLLVYGVYAQDNEYGNNISQIETRVNEIKHSIPPGQDKKYFAALSDIENRKNQLKMLLRTPPAQRDKNWKAKWNENYTKAIEKLNSLK
jgi:hypothetical protein